MDSPTKFLRSLGRSASILVYALGIYGCATVGPQSITAGRGLYNEVINRTEDEQVLNALVRLRYNETFGMISVASVTASLRFRAVATTEIGVGDSVNYAGNLVPLSAGVAYEENPTISYVPLDGEEFMRRMLSPISISEWILMSGSVKRKGDLLGLAVRRINGLRSPLPGDEPPSPQFARALELYDRLRQAAVLDIVQAPETGKKVNYVLLGQAGVLDIVQAPGFGKKINYFWEIHDYEDAHSDSVRELLEILGIDAKLDGSEILLPVRVAVGRSSSAIHVQTRSLYDLLRIFGAGIEIPSAHLEAGIVEPLASVDSEREQLVRIRSSEDRPAAATVQIRFHDRWFYIDATDTRSKGGFMFLRTFIGVRLAARGTAQRAPVLTVPVR
jgi:hypothetical protein